MALAWAFHRQLQRGGGVEGEAHALARVLGGGDVVGGELGLDRVGRVEGGEAADQGVVAAREVRRVGGGWFGEDAAQRVDQMVVDVGRQAVGQGG
jgi:hypothetical protein